MFRVYKPKNVVKVRALHVNKENLKDVASLLMGRVSPLDEAVEVPTFDGPMRFEIGAWVIRAEDNTLTKMSNEEFEKTYEVARNTNGNVQSNHFINC